MKFEYKCPKPSCGAVMPTLSEQPEGMPTCSHGKPVSVHNQPEVMVRVK